MEVWDRLENDFGRADEVGMILLDGFTNLMLSNESDHDNFIELFDKFEETLHDLKEIDRAHLMKEQRTMRDVTEKMSREIKDGYFEYSIKKESGDNPTTDKWEVLLAFMKKQVEISRRWVQSMLCLPGDPHLHPQLWRCEESYEILRLQEVKGPGHRGPWSSWFWSPVVVSNVLAGPTPGMCAGAPSPMESAIVPTGQTGSSQALSSLQGEPFLYRWKLRPGGDQLETTRL